MSRYRGLKYEATYGAKTGYIAKKDLYRILEKYQRKYRSSKYPRPKYQKKSSGRSSRSTGRYRPKPQSTRNPAPKYKKMPKQNLSSPPRETPIRYSHQNHASRTEIDTEQLANAIERKLDGKFTRILLEKLEAEIEELQQKIESKGIDESLETAEEGAKTQVAEVLEGDVEKDTIEEQVEDTEEEVESQSGNEIEMDQEAEVDNETVETEPTETTENPSDVETTESEGRTEIHEEADHLEAYFIDEEWIDEDGLNTLFWSEIEPEQIEQEAEVVEEAELIPPEIEQEPESVDEIIEPEEAGI